MVGVQGRPPGGGEVGENPGGERGTRAAGTDGDAGESSVSQYLRKQVRGTMLYAVGDIHGEQARLEELVASLPLEPEDELVFLGDYIDRGPEPRGVVERTQYWNSAGVMLREHLSAVSYCIPNVSCCAICGVVVVAAVSGSNRCAHSMSNRCKQSILLYSQRIVLCDL